MKIILMLIIVFMFLIFADTKANKRELRITLQPSTISLDPGGVQDSQSLFVSRQVNCQLVRNQGSTYIFDGAESVKYITPLKIIYISSH